MNLALTFCQNEIGNIFFSTCWWSWRWFWRCRESRSPRPRTWYFILLTMIMTILILILVLVILSCWQWLWISSSSSSSSYLLKRLMISFRSVGDFLDVRVILMIIIIFYIFDIIIIACNRGWSNITYQMRNSICGDTILLRFPCKPASYIFDPEEVSFHAMNPQKWRPVFIDFSWKRFLLVRDIWPGI